MQHMSAINSRQDNEVIDIYHSDPTKPLIDECNVVRSIEVCDNTNLYIAMSLCIGNEY